MPLVKIPAIKAPTVSIYIRITDEKGRRRYERVRPRSPQPCGPRDNYALLYYVPKMTWEQVGQDYNEAVRRRAAKEHECLQEKREQSTQPDYHTQGSLVLGGASERVSRYEEKGTEARPHAFRRVHHSRL
jgi:hypothetical protein